MCIKKFLNKIDDMELDNKIILFFFLIAGMFIGLLYVGALIVPNWEGFIEMPWLHQLTAYAVIGLIFLDISFVVVITLKTAITNQVLSDRNETLLKKIAEFEAELKRLEG